MVSLDSLFGEESVVLEETDFQLLLLATTFPILGTSLVSPVLDSVVQPFGTTPARIGLMVSVVTAPAIVLIPIAGALGDRYGRRPVIVGSLLVFGAGGSAIALTTDFRVALGLRFLQGIGFSGLVPIITTSIGDMYDGTQEATAQGLRMATNGISGTVFPLLAGGLVAVAWQLPFLLYALAIPAAAVCYQWFEEPSDGTEAVGGASDDRSYRRAMLTLLARPRVLAVVAARTLPVVVWIAFLTYNSLIVVRLLGGTSVQAGLLAAAGNFVFAVAGSQAGRITFHAGSRFYPLLVGNVLLAGGFGIVLLAPGLLVAIAGIVVAGAGFGVTLTLYRSIITAMAPPELRGGLVSIGAAGARVTATVTPVAMGAIIAALEPSLGLAGALRVAGLAAAAVGGLGGVVALLAARVAPAVATGASTFRPG